MDVQQRKWMIEKYENEHLNMNWWFYALADWIEVTSLIRAALPDESTAQLDENQYEHVHAMDSVDPSNRKLNQRGINLFDDRFRRSTMARRE